jgi:hypothetical protein
MNVMGERIMPIGRLIVAPLAALLVATYGLPSEAQAQYRPYYHQRHNGNHGWHHNGWNNGGAAAAGVVGGLALGALAAGAAHPYGYGYGYPAGGYPASGYRAYNDYGGCYVARQRVIDDWGYPHWRRIRVCE